MKITCPNCSTTYEVGATSIAPEGRDVRCSRCGTTWHIEGETNAAIADAWEEEALSDDFDDEEMDAPLSRADSDDEEVASEPDPNWAFSAEDEDEDQPVGSGSDDDWETEIGLKDPVADRGAYETDGNGGDAEPLPVADLETAAERTRKRRQRKGSARKAARYRVSPQMRAAMGLILFAGSIVLSVAMITLREPIVRAAPNLADLYAYIGMEVNLRGLEFRDLRTFREYEKGAPVLIVEGTVENVRTNSAYVPAIRLALRSGDAQEIYAWTVEPRQLRLRAGQSMRFSTRLASPPDVASDVMLRFTDRAKRQTDL